MSYLPAWLEWKERCAARLCSDTTQHQLFSFAHSCFVRYVRRCSAELSIVGVGAHRMPGADAWHLLESRVTVKETQQGKSYKDWLFDRSRRRTGSQLDSVQGGASLIMRDAVREHLRSEHKRFGTVSLDALIVGEEGDAGSLADILAADTDPVSEVALREYRELARGIACAMVEEMSWRERIALLVHRLGLRFSDATVEHVAQCRKSTLFNVYRDYVVGVMQHLRARYAEEPVDALVTLALMTLGEIKEKVFLWGTLESTCTPLFWLVEGNDETAIPETVPGR